MNPEIIKFGVVGVYFAALFVIAYYASRRICDISDFFVGGKKLNYWIVAFSSRATGESGWLLLGLTGLGFSAGAHAFWVLMGEMMGVAVCWVFLTQRFKSLTDLYGSITVPDYLESRLGDKTHAIRIFSAIVLVVFVTAYLSAQLTATGKAFDTFLGLPYKGGVLLGLGIILAYTVAGGFVAVAWSDLLQGILMCAGLAFLPAAALWHLGGFSPLLEGLRALDPQLLSPWGSDGFGFTSVLSALGLLAVGLGYLGSPQLSVRFMALRDIREFRQGAIVAVLFTLIADAGAIFTGLCGRVIYKTLADPETVLPLLVNDLMPPVLVGAFISVVLAAIMSTADSLLILASSAVVRDLYQKVLHPEATDKSLTRLSRWVTTGLCAAALVFALAKVRLIFWFVLLAWAGITAVFCPVIVLSLFWKGLTRNGALAGMVTGFSVTLLWKTFLGSLMYEMIPACAAATLVAVLVSWTGRPPSAAGDLDDLPRKVVDIWDRT